MARRRRVEFWSEPLPSEVEWLLAAVFLGAWVIGSILFYWKVLGRVEHVFEAFAPLGITMDESALKPVAEIAFKFAPVAGLPVALTAWQWARRKIVRMFATL